MRIRRKKWAATELENCKFYINDPNIFYNSWNKKFNNSNPIHIELGCGKGQFISKLASNNTNTNYIAVDMIEAMLGLSKRNIEKEYNEKNIDFSNIFLIRSNVEYISKVFGNEDKIDRIYINFCNPWPRGKHNKRRLTHPRQLEQYKSFMNDGASIYFKTDDDALFEDSISYFNNSNFEIIKLTYDLASEDIFEGNIKTEHEMMFESQGTKIKALIAKVNK
jgi:tRNA (guanine-N7-)-methyltransferase